jgi:hypothetical protein
LPDPRAAALDVEAHALLPVVELDLCDLDAAAVRERFPVGFEVLALESGTANLFGEQPVDHRVIDVLEEVAVDSLVDRSGGPVRIDEQDGDSRHPIARSSSRKARARYEEGQGSGGGRHRTRKEAASIHMRFPLCVQP